MGTITFGFKNIAAKSGHLEERWNYDTNSLLLAAPKIADIDGDGKQEILFGTKEGRLISIDLDGNLKWSFSVSNEYTDMELMFLDAETSNSISGTPNIEDINNDGKKEIVFGTEQGILHVLDYSGKELWKFPTGGPIRGAALIQRFANNQTGVFFGSHDKQLYFLNGAGQLYWKFAADSPIESCPILTPTPVPMIIFGTNDGTLYSINLKSELLWKYAIGRKILAQAVSVRDEKENLRIIVGATDGDIYCIDENGALLWRFHTEGAIFSPVTVDDINNDGKKEIVFGSCDNKVYALTIDGKELWNYETDFWVVTSPLIADIDGDGRKEIVVGSYDHNIYILDAEGSYLLDYVPGVSGIVGQTGQYGEALTKQPGKTKGKKIWQYQTEGIIVGCAHIDGSIIVNTESGKINDLVHRKT